jgi:beta-glucosidase
MSVFGSQFLWGVSTAAAQIEGGYLDDGRTKSIWDVAPTSKIKNGETCHIACDHYHRYKEDVAIMKEIGVKSYRFSISWSRVIPKEGVINEKGIAFYSSLIDELISSSIEPIVTLYHWDLPLWAEEKGGWANPDIVRLFSEYTKAVVEAFSDRVTYWLTFNEPQCFLMNGHITCVHAPFKRVIFRFSRLISHFMLANKESVRVIREYAKKTPKVGLSFGSGAFIPENAKDKSSIEEARRKSFEVGMGIMNNRLWFDPVIKGKGASAFLIYHVSDSFAKKVQTDFDFLAINNYEAFNYSPWGEGRHVDKSDKFLNSMGWVCDGRTLYWTSKFMYERYNLPIMITENGYCDNDELKDGKVIDTKRIEYMDDYISNVRKAIEDGVNIIGYHYWSLLDNFEWAEGYEPRFGLIYVDYKTGRRTMKESAFHYKNIIKEN